MVFVVDNVLGVVIVVHCRVEIVEVDRIVVGDGILVQRSRKVSGLFRRVTQNLHVRHLPVSLGMVDHDLDRAQDIHVEEKQS